MDFENIAFLKSDIAEFRHFLYDLNWIESFKQKPTHNLN